MLFKGVDFWPHGSNLQVLSLRKYFIALSSVLALFAAVELGLNGLNFGIDFVGGSLFEVKATKCEKEPCKVDVPGLRQKLGALNLGDVQVQAIGAKGDEALIRIEKQKGDEKAQQAAVKQISSVLQETVEIRRTEVVGAAVSDELKEAGLFAVLSAITGILLYIWFRFEWQFGVAAILALVHDVFITVGVFALLGLEFDLSIVAALLTLAGYSINDTVVVFDRIRENLRKFKKKPLPELLNLSINETLSRTVLTSMTTLLAVGSLYIFGTEVIRGFAFAMLFGIIIGTWSSIFVASPFLMWIGVSRDWSGVKEGRGPSGRGSTPARV